MGMLTSDTDHSGMVVRDVLLGLPACDIDDDGNPVGPYKWEDGRFPNGLIDADGTIIVTDGEQ